MKNSNKALKGINVVSDKYENTEYFWCQNLSFICLSVCITSLELSSIEYPKYSGHWILVLVLLWFKIS